MTDSAYMCYTCNMPLVKIEIQKGFTPEYKKTVLDCVHEGLVQALNIEDDDRFQRLYELESENFETSSEKTKHFTLIEITMFPGRTKEQKKAVIECVSNNLHKKLNIELKDIFIILIEPPLENWGMRGKQKNS